jgi:hypothetical protein
MRVRKEEERKREKGEKRGSTEEKTAWLADRRWCIGLTGSTCSKNASAGELTRDARSAILKF